MTPREIVAELDKYIVGQNAAKRAVAVALRNRVRRQKLPPEMAEDVMPKNILMIGPTGVGKTEIARRLARLAGCPFVKVEASQIHRSRLRRPRRRIHGPRPRRNLHRHGPRRKARRSRRSRRTSRRRARSRLAAASVSAARSQHIRSRRRCSSANKRSARAKNSAPSSAKANSTSAWSTSKSANARCQSFEIIANQGVEEMDVNSERHALRHVRPAKKEAQDDRRRRLRISDPGRRKQTPRHGSGHAHGRRARRADGHHLHRRNRQSRRPRIAATAPMFHAKACSATFCRSSKAPPSTRATA